MEPLTLTWHERESKVYAQVGRHYLPAIADPRYYPDGYRVVGLGCDGGVVVESEPAADAAFVVG